MSKTLREHQSESVNAIFDAISKGVAKGIINLPTGTGKTVIEEEATCRLIEAIDRKINDTINEDKILDALYNQIANTSQKEATVDKSKDYGAIVVVSPRILLSYQLCSEYIRYLSEKKVGAFYLQVNSGKYSSEESEKVVAKHGLQAYKVPSTTDFSEIKKYYLKCEAVKMPIVIFSTYDSVVQVQKAGIKVKAYLFDEGHYLVNTTGGKLNRSKPHEATYYDSDFKFFFTATMKTTDSDESVGMNNTEAFGEILYKKTPRQMIEAGEMVKPAIHLVSAIGTTILDDASYDYKSIVDCISNSFAAHEKAVKEHSSQPDQIGAKMLLVMEGQRQLEGVFETPEMIAFAKNNPDIQVIAMSSDFGIFINGTRYKYSNASKQKALDAIKNLKNTDRAIIYHVDMMSEGLDCPGITGDMFFRNVGKIKFMQNTGRATRLHPIDREKLYNGTLIAGDYKNYVKPYAWVILPVFTANAIDFTERYKTIIRCMRSDYEFSSSELVILGNNNAAKELEEIEEVGQEERQIRSMEHEIRNFVHTLEKEEMLQLAFDAYFRTNTLTDIDKSAVFTELFKNRNLLNKWEEVPEKLQKVETVT